jgi:hypothetical protein
MSNKLTLSQLEALHAFNKIYTQVSRDEGMSLIHAAINHMQRKILHNALKSYLQDDNDQAFLTSIIRRGLRALEETFNPKFFHLDSGDTVNDLSIGASKC